MNKPRSKAESAAREIDSELFEFRHNTKGHNFSRRRINKATRAQGKREINDGLNEHRLEVVSYENCK